MNRSVEKLGIKAVLMVLMLLCVACKRVPEKTPPMMFAPELSLDQVIHYDYAAQFNRHTDLKPPRCAAPVMRELWSDSKVIRVMGFDAVCWPIVNILIKRHELPTFERLVCEGATAILKTDWADSPVSWTTIATGRSMEQHGILSVRVTGQSPFNYLKEAVMKPRLWDILRYHKIPMTIGKYYLTAEGGHGRSSMTEQCQASMQDISRAPEECYITIIEATDLHFHESLLAFALKETAWGNEVTIEPCWQSWFNQNAAVVRDALKVMDRTVGELLAQYPDDTLLIVSDHGATVRNPYVRLCPNPNLLFPGCEIRPEGDQELAILESGLTVRFAMRNKFYSMARQNTTSEVLPLKVVVPLITIENQEAVPKTDVAAVVEKLSTLEAKGIKLLDRNPEGGFVLNPNLLEAYVQNRFRDPLVRDAIVFGEHDPTEHGIFIAYGRHIRPGVDAGICELIDIVPTVLYLAGLPLGKDLEGKVVTNIITEEYLRQQPIEYIASYDDVIAVNGKRGARTGMTDDAKAKYRRLGYPGLD